MKTLAVLALIGLLAACGADGDPTRPEKGEPLFSGVSLTGTATVGVSG